jgi:hypothetical protein
MLAGKTHMLPDARGMKRLALDGQNELAVLLREGWFELIDRHDGHHAETDSAYADWLRDKGYASKDPWTDYVIAVTDEKVKHAMAGKCATPACPRAYAKNIAKPPIRPIAPWNSLKRRAMHLGFCIFPM